MAVSEQIPVNSGFDGKSTGAEVAAAFDLTGKTAVVTGGYSGIGLETVRVLADRGASVIVPVRSPDKASAALAGIAGNIRTLPMDLGDPGSVRSAADQLCDELNTLDLLINNAGIMACPLARVGPGWESQFGINHMGHFALTQGLMPLLENTGGARVVALSSGGHKMGDVNWDDIQYQHTEYDKWKAYGQAKTANALFANALSRRLRPAGGLAFSLHPGAIFTPLQRHLPQAEMIALGWLSEDGSPSDMARRVFKTVEQGCATTLWAATAPGLDGKPGVYCEDCDIAVLSDPENPETRFIGVRAYACDDDAAERLWQISEALLADA